jgi:hypothetical protein
MKPKQWKEKYIFCFKEFVSETLFLDFSIVALRSYIWTFPDMFRKQPGRQ